MKHSLRESLNFDQSPIKNYKEVEDSKEINNLEKELLFNRNHEDQVPLPIKTKTENLNSENLNFVESLDLGQNLEVNNFKLES